MGTKPYSCTIIAFSALFEAKEATPKRVIVARYIGKFCVTFGGKSSLRSSRFLYLEIDFCLSKEVDFLIRLATSELSKCLHAMTLWSFSAFLVLF